MSLWHLIPALCPCGTKDQTIDPMLLECKLLNKERDSLISNTDVQPISKNKLISNHYKIFAKFTKETSFEKLNEVFK
jgi:hypothetical protein